MFRRFERLVETYPAAKPAIAAALVFCLPVACTAGLRPYILGMTLCTAAIGAFEALLFAMLGTRRRLARRRRSRPSCGTRERGSLLLLGAVLAASPLVVAAVRAAQAPGAVAQLPDAAALELPPADARPEHELLPGRVCRPGRHQGDADLAGGARRRDDRRRHPGVHRHLLRHHGRRCVGTFDLRLLLPFMGWLALYAVALVRTSCRAWQGGGKAQADARSLMTGRITDAYTNIATVKLFSHASREAGFARAAMQEFMQHGLRADAAGERLRDHEPRPEHAADRRHRRRGAVAVDARARWASGRSRRRAPWRCA